MQEKGRNGKNARSTRMCGTLNHWSYFSATNHVVLTADTGYFVISQDTFESQIRSTKRVSLFFQATTNLVTIIPLQNTPRVVVNHRMNILYNHSLLPSFRAGQYKIYTFHIQTEKNKKLKCLKYCANVTHLEIFKALFYDGPGPLCDQLKTEFSANFHQPDLDVKGNLCVTKKKNCLALKDLFFVCSFSENQMKPHIFTSNVFLQVPLQLGQFTHLHFKCLLNFMLSFHLSGISICSTVSVSQKKCVQLFTSKKEPGIFL